MMFIIPSICLQISYSICHRSAQYLVVSNRVKYFSLFSRYPGTCQIVYFSQIPKIDLLVISRGQSFFGSLFIDTRNYVWKSSAAQWGCGRGILPRTPSYYTIRLNEINGNYAWDIYIYIYIYIYIHNLLHIIQEL